jgi:hypothetical protein
MAKPVRRYRADPGLDPPALKHLPDPARCHRSPGSEPELGTVLLAMLTPNPEVAAESPGTVRADRKRPLLPPLPEDPDLAPVGDVDVLEGDARQLGEADTGVVQDPYDRRVTSVLEPSTLARREQRPISFSCRTSGGFSGTRGGGMCRMGFFPSGTSPSSSHHRKNCRMPSCRFFTLAAA